MPPSLDSWVRVALPVGSAVTHGNQNIEHRLLEEGRLVAVESGQQVTRYIGLDAGDARLDLLHGIESDPSVDVHCDRGSAESLGLVSHHSSPGLA